MPLPFYTGLKPGDPIGGPLYPQIVPEKLEIELGDRARGPVFPPITLLLFEGAKNAASQLQQLFFGSKIKK